MLLPLFQVDAFTNTPFTGNPAAVIPLESWLDDALMQKIAMENNLSETVFFVATPDSVDSDFYIRWFTPTSEVDLCGHATLASAKVLFDELGFDQSSIRFQSKSGILIVKKQGDRFELDFPSRPPEPITLTGLAEALGAEPTEVYQSRDIVAVFEHEDDVRNLKPDFSKLKMLDVFGYSITAPSSTTETGNEEDFVNRFFTPSNGVNEDPVTGSAYCSLIPCWSNRLHKNQLVGQQVSQRTGLVYCELQGDRIKIAGNAVTFLRGQIYI